MILFQPVHDIHDPFNLCMDKRVVLGVVVLFALPLIALRPRCWHMHVDACKKVAYCIRVYIHVLC